MLDFKLIVAGSLLLPEAKSREVHKRKQQVQHKNAHHCGARPANSKSLVRCASIKEYQRDYSQCDSSRQKHPEPEARYYTFRKVEIKHEMQMEARKNSPRIMQSVALRNCGVSCRSSVNRIHLARPYIREAVIVAMPV